MTPAATADRTAADRTAAASRRALLIAVIGTVTSAVVLAASLALGVAALPAAERACARNPYPDACLNDAEFPLSFLGTAGLTAFLGCGLTTLVLAVRRRRRDTPERER